MAEAVYQIEKSGSGWIVKHDGDTSIEYATREAAFEAAVPTASLAIKQGYSVMLIIPAPPEQTTVQ
jgi:hypothetical protein